MERPIIAVDADQVSFDYLGPFCEWHNRIYGTDWKVKRIRVYNLTEALDIPPEELQRRFDIFNMDHLVSLPVIDGAREGFRQLVETGYEIVAVSDRPSKLQRQTEESFERAFGRDVSRVYLTSRGVGPILGDSVTKGTLCRDLGAVAMVEDSKERAADVREKSPGTQVCLFGRYRWNETDGELPNGIVRTYTWTDVVREVNKLRN